LPIACAPRPGARERTGGATARRLARAMTSLAVAEAPPGTPLDFVEKRPLSSSSGRCPGIHAVGDAISPPSTPADTCWGFVLQAVNVVRRKAMFTELRKRGCMITVGSSSGPQGVDERHAVCMLATLGSDAVVAPSLGSSGDGCGSLNRGGVDEVSVMLFENCTSDESPCGSSPAASCGSSSPVKELGLPRKRPTPKRLDDFQSLAPAPLTTWGQVDTIGRKEVSLDSNAALRREDPLRVHSSSSLSSFPERHYRQDARRDKFATMPAHCSVPSTPLTVAAALAAMKTSRPTSGALRNLSRGHSQQMRFARASWPRSTQDIGVFDVFAVPSTGESTPGLPTHAEEAPTAQMLSSTRFASSPPSCDASAPGCQLATPPSGRMLCSASPDATGTSAGISRRKPPGMMELTSPAPLSREASSLGGQELAVAPTMFDLGRLHSSRRPGLLSLATPSSCSSVSYRNMVMTPGTPDPLRGDFKRVAGGVIAVFFDFDGTLTATPGEAAIRGRKQAELAERAPVLAPRLRALRDASVLLGIISRSTENTITSALAEAGLSDFFNGPIVGKALGFDGKAGIIEEQLRSGALAPLSCADGLHRILLVDDDVRELDRARQRGLQTFAAPKEGGLQEEDWDELFDCLGVAFHPIASAMCVPDLPRLGHHAQHEELVQGCGVMSPPTMVPTPVATTVAAQFRAPYGGFEHDFCKASGSVTLSAA